MNSTPIPIKQRNVPYSQNHPHDNSALAVLTFAAGTFSTIEHSASSPLTLTSSLIIRNCDSPRRWPHELWRCQGSSKSRDGIASSTSWAGPPALARAARRARQEAHRRPCAS